MGKHPQRSENACFTGLTPTAIPTTNPISAARTLRFVAPTTALLLAAALLAVVATLSVVVHADQTPQPTHHHTSAASVHHNSANANNYIMVKNVPLTHRISRVNATILFQPLPRELKLHFNENPELQYICVISIYGLKFWQYFHGVEVLNEERRDLRFSGPVPGKLPLGEVEDFFSRNGLHLTIREVESKRLVYKHAEIVHGLGKVLGSTLFLEYTLCDEKGNLHGAYGHHHDRHDDHHGHVHDHEEELQKRAQFKADNKLHHSDADGHHAHL